MTKMRISVVALLLAAGLLSGCWSKREIEELGFATIVALDKAEAGQIELSVQFAITAALGGGAEGGGSPSEAPVWTVSCKGNNLAAAIEEIRTFTGKYPFWAHTRVIIIGEELAQSGIAPVLDYFMRNREFRFSSWVMVSEGPARDLLQVRPKLSQLPAELLSELNQIIGETSISVSRTLIDLLEQLIEEHASEPILPLVTIYEAPETDQASSDAEQSEGQKQEETAENKAESLMITGLAVFQGDKLVGKLGEINSRGIVLLRGESIRGSTVVDVPGKGYVVQNQIYGRRTLHITQEDGQPKAKIVIYQDGDLAEHNINRLDLTPEAIAELDGLLSAHIQGVVEVALAKTQKELKADIIGIGDRVYRLYPELYQSLNWQEYYPTMPIEVEVQASFRRTGETLQSPLTSKYRSE